MPVEDDVREIRGHLMNLVGMTGRMDGKIDAIDGRLDTMEVTISTHTRPCSDLKELRTKVERFAVAPTAPTAPAESNTAVLKEAVKEERSLLRLVLMKIVVPLITAIGAVIAYIFASSGPKG